MASAKTKASKRERAANAMFMRRSYAIFKHMSTRLRSKPFEVELPFSLDELRARVTAALGAPCAYCGEPVTPRNFSIDHRTPLNRADEIVAIQWLARLDNLAVCCAGCQRLKGAMDQDEYGRLLTLVEGFDGLARRDIKRRLKAGGAVVRCGIARL